MNDFKSIISDVLVRLEEAVEPGRAEENMSNRPTAQKILGVKVPAMRVIRKDLSKQVKAWTGEEVLNLAAAMVDREILECRQVAYEMVSEHKKAMKALDLEQLKRLGRFLDNWVSVDNYSVLLVGVAWREGQISTEIIKEWARSDDRWWRRTAVVSTVALNMKARGGTGDAERTLNICALVAADKDDMVAKGLSWALRALLVREQKPVVRFLDEYDAVLPARVKREVKRKLETGRKYDPPKKK